MKPLSSFNVPSHQRFSGTLFVQTEKWNPQGTAPPQPISEQHQAVVHKVGDTADDVIDWNMVTVNGGELRGKFSALRFLPGKQQAEQDAKAFLQAEGIPFHWNASALIEETKTPHAIRNTLGSMLSREARQLDPEMPEQVTARVIDYTG